MTIDLAGFIDNDDDGEADDSIGTQRFIDSDAGLLGAAENDFNDHRVFHLFATYTGCYVLYIYEYIYY